MLLLCFGLYHFTFKVWLKSYTNHNQEIELPDLYQMHIDDALKTLDSLGLTYEVDSVRFDSAYLPLSVLESYPEKGFKVKKGRKILIKSNPSDWRPTFLPDIVGKSKRLAITQLKLAGLEVGDTIYKPDLARDAVLGVMYKGRSIEKDFELPRFAKVDLILGKGLEYGVKTPDLIGMFLEEAESSILANRFDVGRLSVEGLVVDSSELRVFYQYPLPNDNYDQGLPVDLWLSTKDIKSLENIIKDLNRQYRNFGDNDSLAIETYKGELNLDDESINSPQLQALGDSDENEENEEKTEGNSGSRGFQFD